jgi:hypothetical protein
MQQRRKMYNEMYNAMFKSNAVLASLPRRERCK